SSYTVPTPTTALYILSLHDALPISSVYSSGAAGVPRLRIHEPVEQASVAAPLARHRSCSSCSWEFTDCRSSQWQTTSASMTCTRSEEHTSELQSREKSRMPSSA